MTPADYKATRQRLGMRPEQLAAALGVSRATVFRREAEGGTVSEEAARAIRSLEEERKQTAKEP